ncbi:MAG: hypothetical protein DRP37_05535 [Thermodesulfobacteriota bacterium]|nr:MAG: hypothetical protein DRP37_05535 [Thermodesulfobacteriota bacterium]
MNDNPGSGIHSPQSSDSRESSRRTAVMIFLFIVLLYFFLVSISSMETAFKYFGAGFSQKLFALTSNPFVGLFVGILATSLIQSSSATTSLVVVLVSSGALDVANAVPVIMGTNIGTSVTNTLVSIGHITRAVEFRRAFAAATVHDFFNLFSVAVLLPVEMYTGYLQKTATWFAGLLTHAHGVTYTSSVKAITKPAVLIVYKGLQNVLDHPWAGIILLALGLVVLFLSLWGIARIMRILMMDRVAVVFDHFLGKSALACMAVGAICTAIVQSSSITTSLLVPLAGAGIVRLRTIFPITLGSNVGTTVTALLAAMATGAVGGQGPAGLIIALCTSFLMFRVSC